ncbi:MAG: hypothetical protein EOM64_03760 [Erysipelotrichia bacterium]|nr:hypothetical protein [Erysipelotrichia bacterium]
MEREEYKRLITHFHSSCKVFLKEIERVLEIEKQYPAVKDLKFDDQIFRIGLSDNTGRGMLELYQFLNADINYVKDIFSQIEKLCGHNAKVIIWSLFVEDRIQEDVAAEYGLTRRQVQYSVEHWMLEVFESEQHAE